MRFLPALPACFGIAAISAMGLTACMSTQETESPSSENRRITEQEFEAAAGLFKTTASMTGAKVAALDPGTQAQMNQAREQMRAAGVCEGMIGIVDDLIRFIGDFDDAMENPQSEADFDPNFSAYPHLNRMINCLPDLIAADETGEFMSGLDQFDALNTCICAGTGSMFGNFHDLARSEWTGFSPAAVTDGGFAPAAATSSGFQPASNAGYQPSGTSGGYSPSSP